MSRFRVASVRHMSRAATRGAELQRQGFLSIVSRPPHGPERREFGGPRSAMVPLRQFVITFPFELRARLAYDGKLLGAATRVAIDSVLGFYKRRAAASSKAAKN